MMFKTPVLLLTIPLFLLVLFFIGRKPRSGYFVFPTDEIIRYAGGGLKLWLVRKMVYLRVAAMLLILVALAGPQISRMAPVKKLGVGVVLAVDCSSTMLAEDLQIDMTTLAEGKVSSDQKNMKRIDAVKMAARDFVKARPDDLVGMVAFASEAFIICPLTFHHEWLRQSLDRVKVGLIKDGTAIGSGIMSSLNMLKDSKAKSKVIIILTDGINNFGKIPPLVAAKAARALGVKIYTVGLVSASQMEDADDWSGRKVFKKKKIQVEEGDLRKIANITGGKYFRATDVSSLRETYREIDRLEKVTLEEKSYEEYVDVFTYFIYAAMALLLLEMALSNTVLRRIP
jgi:Ca-activated chloride channel homolog